MHSTVLTPCPAACLALNRWWCQTWGLSRWLESLILANAQLKLVFSLGFSFRSNHRRLPLEDLPGSSFIADFSMLPCSFLTLCFAGSNYWSGSFSLVPKPTDQFRWVPPLALCCALSIKAQLTADLPIAILVKMVRKQNQPRGPLTDECSTETHNGILFSHKKMK